jgi:hypothetical protein
MKKKISFDYDKEAGLTIAQLRTPKGTFFGTSQKHPDDKFNSSEYIGSEIAEARAYINFINDKIYDKKNELKGLKRLLCAMPPETTGRNYAEHLYKAISFEISDLEEDKQFYKNRINQVIEARKIYIRSRSATKEEKNKMQAAIAEGFKTISQVKTAKEEE